MTEWLPEDHVVWFVLEAVDRVDTSAFHARAKLGGVGRAGYDPDMLLALFVYAMAHAVRSSRQIERLCGTDVAFKVICAGDVPDHTVLARFRQRHEAALEDLLTEVLVLCAQLGMVRLGVVAVDGTKVAGNASRYANRTEEGLRRLAKRHLAEAAATDAAEDEEFGAGRGDELPEKLRDRTGRGRRIGQALEEIARRKAAKPAKGSRAAADAYEQRLRDAAADPNAPLPFGVAPARADPVVVARAKWERERARAQRRYEGFAARADVRAAQGRPDPGGPRPVPPDEKVKVRRRRAAYEAAVAAARADSDQGTGDQGTGDQGTGRMRGRDKGPIANLTDPQSRLLKSRNGWVQGYNGQTSVSEDGFILNARATRDANEVPQFTPAVAAVEAICEELARRTGRADLEVGVVVADSGYDSDENLDTSQGGVDRLIANGTGHSMAKRAKDEPVTGEAPEDASDRDRMDHRLRTPRGQALYKRRSPIVEAPNAWLKDGRGLRTGFARRGQAAASSELAFAAAVTNLLHLFNSGITTTQVAAPATIPTT
jgi:transposase